MDSADKPDAYSQPLPPLSVAACCSHLAGLGYRHDAPGQRISAYQRFMGLPETGEVDAATLAELSLGRCGVPDPAEDVEFGENVTRWRINVVKYFVEPIPADLPPAKIRSFPSFIFPAPLAGDEFLAVVRRSFRLWAQEIAPALSFMATDVKDEANITIGFRPFSTALADGLLDAMGLAVAPPNPGSKINTNTHGLTISLIQAEPWASSA